MDYQLESKLRDKVDRQEYRSQKEEINNLRNQIEELKRTIGQCQSRMSNQSYAIGRIVIALINSNCCAGHEDILNEIQQYNY